MPRKAERVGLLSSHREKIEPHLLLVIRHFGMEGKAVNSLLFAVLYCSIAAPSKIAPAIFGKYFHVQLHSAAICHRASKTWSPIRVWQALVCRPRKQPALNLRARQVEASYLQESRQSSSMCVDCEE